MLIVTSLGTLWRRLSVCFLFIDIGLIRRHACSGCAWAKHYWYLIWCLRPMVENSSSLMSRSRLTGDNLMSRSSFCKQYFKSHIFLISRSCFQRTWSVFVSLCSTRHWIISTMWFKLWVSWFWWLGTMASRLLISRPCWKVVVVGQPGPSGQSW